MEPAGMEKFDPSARLIANNLEAEEPFQLIVIELPSEVNEKFPCTTKAKVEPVAVMPVGAIAPEAVTDALPGTVTAELENVTFPATMVGYAPSRRDSRASSVLDSCELSGNFRKFFMSAN
jgi:hypothetical protein